jgi:acetate kinase
VHGGTRFTGPVALDDAVAADLRGLVDLAPLHLPAALAAIDAVRRVLPAAPQVACFDTAFHTALPAAARTYAVPADWRERLGVRRYGFHGLSHSYASRRTARLLADPGSGSDPDPGSDPGSGSGSGSDPDPGSGSGGEPAGSGARLVTCHLGAGASLAAVRLDPDGPRCLDTTMGFTPLEGLVMATRSGSVDPGLVLWLIRRAGLSPAEVDDALLHRSGLAGLAGTPDMKAVLERAAAGDADARLAVEVYLHRLRSSVASMAAAVGGLDALVFTGGVGERAAAVRAGAADGLGFLGVALDADRNDAAAVSDATAEVEVSARGAAVRTFVLHAREDLEIARGVRSVVAPGGRRAPRGEVVPPSRAV